DGIQGKHRVTKRGPALSNPMFTLVTGIVGRWRALNPFMTQPILTLKTLPFFAILTSYISVIKMHFGTNLPADSAGALEDGGAQGEDGRTPGGTHSIIKLVMFANASVVKTYVILLKNYHQNSAHTNHCAVKMLHRIAYDLKMEAFLFQLSVFCTFNRILCDPAAGAYKELVAFSKYILNKFFALAATNNKAYVELLFWKNTNLIREITEGYRKPDEEESDSNRKRIKWTPQDEEELQRLYLQYKEVEGVDVIDNILANLKPGTRTRKQVINHLVQMGLAESVMDFKKQIKRAHVPSPDHGPVGYSASASSASRYPSPDNPNDSEYESDDSYVQDSSSSQVTLDSLIEAVNQTLKVAEESISTPEHVSKKFLSLILSSRRLYKNIGTVLVNASWVKSPSRPNILFLRN
ncbi:unnamed protein product, partial [Ranitomeya imitator]